MFCCDLGHYHNWVQSTVPELGWTFKMVVLVSLFSQVLSNFVLTAFELGLTYFRVTAALTIRKLPFCVYKITIEVNSKILVSCQKIYFIVKKLKQTSGQGTHVYKCVCVCVGGGGGGICIFLCAGSEGERERSMKFYFTILEEGGRERERDLWNFYFTIFEERERERSMKFLFHNFGMCVQQLSIYALLVCLKWVCRCDRYTFTLKQCEKRFKVCIDLQKCSIILKWQSMVDKTLKAVTKISGRIYEKSNVIPHFLVYLAGICVNIFLRFSNFLQILWSLTALSFSRHHGLSYLFVSFVPFLLGLWRVW